MALSLRAARGVAKSSPDAAGTPTLSQLLAIAVVLAATLILFLLPAAVGLVSLFAP